MIDTILRWIGQFLGWLDKITGNYMLALFLFALVVEILMLPFAIKQQKNTIKQASLAPKEMAIKNKYKGRNDKVTQQKMNEEIQRMYQEENFNQFAGCLPTLLQLPVILALYQVVINPLQYVVGISKNAITAMTSYVGSLSADTLGQAFSGKRGTIELISLINNKGMEFFKGVIDYVNGGVEALKDIGLTGEQVYDAFASKVPSFPNFNVIGIDLGGTVSIKEPSLLWIVPVLTFLVYFLSMKLTRKLGYQPQSTGDGAADKATGCSNNMMDIMMPAVSAYIAFIVPAAIGVYWIFKSIITTFKQFLLSKIMPLPKFSEADYKAAEREYAGKSKDRKTRLDVDATAANPKSLFRQDQEDYVPPEIESEIEKKLRSTDPEDGGLLTKAPLKDDSDKNPKKK